MLVPVRQHTKLFHEIKQNADVSYGSQIYGFSVRSLLRNPHSRAKGFQVFGSFSYAILLVQKLYHQPKLAC